MDLNFLIQAIVAMLVITSPFSPDKIILFNIIIEREGLSRTGSALKVSLITFGIFLLDHLNCFPHSLGIGRR